MTKSRLEAFSDGVLAIIITIMVLELKPPHEPTFAALCAQYPLYLSYVLSFINIGIYWNNHHHLFHSVKNISGAVMWANLHLLFWLSLMPIATAWAGESKFAGPPVAVYGIDLGFCGLAYYILQLCLVKANGRDSEIAKALGNDFKGKFSVMIYAVAIPVAFFIPLISCLIFIVVAGMWLVPDKRFEERKYD
jgi:uncharacterized membrane protein